MQGDTRRGRATNPAGAAGSFLCHRKAILVRGITPTADRDRPCVWQECCADCGGSNELIAGPWARWSRLSRASPVGAASQNLGGPQFGAAFVFALQHFPKGRVIRSVTTATPSQRQLARLLDAEPALLASLLDVHPGRAPVRHVPTGPGVGRGDWGMPGPRLRVKAVGAGIDTRRGVTLPQPPHALGRLPPIGLVAMPPSAGGPLPWPGQATRSPSRRGGRGLGDRRIPWRVRAAGQLRPGKIGLLSGAWRFLPPARAAINSTNAARVMLVGRSCSVRMMPWGRKAAR
jgi:hypothetical protein